MCKGKVTRREKCRWCDADEANADAEALAVADEGPEWRKSGSGRWYARVSVWHERQPLGSHVVRRCGARRCFRGYTSVLDWNCHCFRYAIGCCRLLTVGGLVTFYGYMTYLGAPLRRVLCTVETFVSARVSARKTVAILDASYGESPTVPGDSFAQTVNKRIAPR